MASDGFDQKGTDVVPINGKRFFMSTKTPPTGLPVDDDVYDEISSFQESSWDFYGICFSHCGCSSAVGTGSEEKLPM